jgi:F-type H+-transporting ATPase subunit delta
LLARRYARALFEVAEEASAVDRVAEDLEQIAEALRDPTVRAVLNDPGTGRTRHKATLERALDSAHQITRNVVQVLLRRRREAVLPDLCVAFAELVRTARGEDVGTIETAHPLDEAQLRGIAASVAAAFGKRIDLRQVVDPELIGGVRLRVGNTLYDASVATRLEQLERRLREVPLP